MTPKNSFKPIIYYLLSLTLLSVSCSTAPKRPVEIFTTRQMAETQLELVNKTADQGDYEKALLLMKDARRLAVSTDNASLRVRTNLAEGNILFYLNRTDEADEVWNRALTEAERTKEIELAAQTRIYLARSGLISGKSSPDQVKDIVNREISSIKNDKLSIALGWTVIGQAEKANRNFRESETAFKKAFDIHSKGNYLEQAAYDWYLIASSRSVAGQYDAAIEALNTAIGFDRRAENTYGLAMDWRALGDVYKKAGKSPEAQAAYNRSIEILKAIPLEKAAEEVEGRK
jgi:tetratricopeptide (TPR) repeat protein